MSDVSLREETFAIDEAGLVGLLLTISKSTRAFVALLLSEIDLHPGQDQLLDRLDRDIPISVSGLAELLAVRPSTVSKMLDRLIERGLVTRVASNDDARRTLVSLTPEGEAAQEAVRRLWRRLERDLLAALPSENAADTLSALARVDEVLRTRLRRLR